ncbi:hypothetical protein [Nitrosopumilus sp.]|uniref:hypothetical protein n=1 Tax=Nitrosopumilus sp. TaxID=2024843 RepID=UPI00262AA3EE|nr:hypothetical protein [Nitrosopumilus sp.]
MNSVIKEKKRPETEIFLEILKYTECISGDNLCKTHSEKVKQILMADAKDALDKLSECD